MELARPNLKELVFRIGEVGRGKDTIIYCHEKVSEVQGTEIQSCFRVKRSGLISGYDGGFFAFGEFLCLPSDCKLND